MKTASQIKQQSPCWPIHILPGSASAPSSSPHNTPRSKSSSHPVLCAHARPRRHPWVLSVSHPAPVSPIFCGSSSGRIPLLCPGPRSRAFARTVSCMIRRPRDSSSRRRVRQRTQVFQFSTRRWRARQLRGGRSMNRRTVHESRS